MSTQPTAYDQYTLNEFRDYTIYRELARVETVPEFKGILERLVEQEWNDYQYWLQYSTRKEFSMSAWELFWLKLVRKVLGLTFMAKFIELNERRAIRDYTALMASSSGEMRERIARIIEHEKQHEKHMIDQIREEKVKFMGSVVLGLNDALIELTGALLGFSFMLGSRWVAVVGAVTGVSAGMSMASSAYLQARHETDRDPRKAALYTGVSYCIVAFLMIVPYLFLSGFAAIAGMFGVVLLIIAAISYYTSVLFERDFKSQFAEMALCSLGVGAVASLIGWFLHRLTGIQV